MKTKLVNGESMQMRSKLVSCLKEYVRFMKGEQGNALDRASGLDNYGRQGERDALTIAAKIAQAKVLLAQFNLHGKILI